jgi:hypothetical protein
MSAHQLPRELHIAPFEIIDPGDGEAITVDRWNQHVPLEIGAGAETNTLPDPTRAGQRVCLMAFSVGGGSRAITADSPINQTGNTVMTFAAVDDMIVLESFPVGDGAYEWRAVANDGCALS